MEIMFCGRVGSRKYTAEYDKKNILIRIGENYGGL